MQFPYIPHTDEDVREMLGRSGARSIDELFNDIPENIRLKKLLDLPKALSELELRAELYNIASENKNSTDNAVFLGAGSYDHYIPSVVNHIAGRAEFYTAYTPYQAEFSQGVLQVFFEYQTMICRLTGMDVSNASMYDGASALAESILMACNTGSRKKAIISRGIHPEYISTSRTYLKNTGIEIIEVDIKNGITDIVMLGALVDENTGCVVFSNPNFFGCIEDVFEIEKICHSKGAYLIASVDPISLGLLVPPSEYNADIAVGEGQPLGNDMSFGGPYLGFFAAKKDFLRKMPGRIIGLSADKDGLPACTLTLQTREQHIRREKATSNICSNEALCALKAAVYLSVVGKEGLKEIALQCAQKAHYLKEQIIKISGFKEKFTSPFFKEFAIECKKSVKEINEELLKKNIIGGYDLGRAYPEMKNTMLLCVTEKRTEEEIDRFVNVLKKVK